jgi:hypothetical protein
LTTVEETAVGRITGDKLGPFGSANVIPEASSDSAVHIDRFLASITVSILVLGVVQQKVHQHHVISSVYMII